MSDEEQDYDFELEPGTSLVTFTPPAEEPTQVVATRIDPIAKLLAAIDDITVESKVDDVAMILDRLEGLQARIKEVKEKLNPIVLHYLETNKTCIQIGPVKYYVGTKKTEKVKKLEVTLEKTLELVGGDFEALADTLSVNAFKIGKMKKLLGNDFESHFTITIVNDLQTERPKRELKKADERFIKSRGAPTKALPAAPTSLDPKENNF